MGKGSLRASRSTKKEKPETIQAVVRRALAREQTNMQEEGTPHIDAGWTGDALASWIAPGVIWSVQEFIAKGGK